MIEPSEVFRVFQEYRGDAIVIPVILRACDWHASPIGNLQALPKDAKPVKSWDDIDEAFTDVAKGIRKSVEHVQGKALGTRP